MTRDPRDLEGSYRRTNDLGADDFGTLWLAATDDCVNAFRICGLGDQIERDYALRAAVSIAIYRSLLLATKHPNNLARAVKRREERKQKEEQEVTNAQP